MMMPSAAYGVPVAAPALAMYQPAVSLVPVPTYSVAAVPQVAWQSLLLANAQTAVQQPPAAPVADAQQSTACLSAASLATLRTLLDTIAARETAARAQAADTTGKTLDSRVSDLEKRVGRVERAMDDLVASVTAHQNKIEQLQRHLPSGK
jgi:hypothetical protein